MTSASDAPLVDIQRYTAESVKSVIADIARVYEVVYHEPPYLEGPEDVAAFIDGLPRRAAQRGFRLVTATADRKPIGFAFGHQLSPDARWWKGATTPLPDAISREYPGRTFAIIELAVEKPFRRRGIAKAMHDALLVNATEERATLLVRPEAKPAQNAYQRWGYVRVGSIRPWTDAPLYHAMVLELRTTR